MRRIHQSADNPINLLCGQLLRIAPNNKSQRKQ
jgi:hypothetical protein